MDTSQAETRRARTERALWSAVVSGGAAGVVLQSVHLGLRFVLTPFVLARAGLEAFGLWSLVFVTFGALGLHRSGLLGAACAVTARQVAARDLRGARGTLGAVASLAGAAALLCITALGFGAETVIALLGVEGELSGPGASLLRIVAAATALQLLTTPLHAAHEALQRHVHLRAAEATSALLEACLVFAGLGLLDLSPGEAVIVLGWAFVARAALLLVLHAAALRRTRAGRILLAAPVRPTRAQLRELLPFAGALQLLGSLHLAILAIPRVVLGRTLGLGAVGAFEAGRKLVELTASLPLPAIAPLASASAALTAERGEGAARVDRAHGPLLVATRLAAAAGASLLAVLAAGAERVSVAWLGAPDATVEFALRVLAPAAALHLATGPATALLRGLRRPGAEIAYSFAWLVLLAGLVALASRTGVEQVLLAVAVSQAAVSAWLLHHAAGRLSMARTALMQDAARGLAVGLAAFTASALAAGAFPLPETRLDAVLQLVPITAAALAASVLAGVALLLPRSTRSGLIQRLTTRRAPCA